MGFRKVLSNRDFAALWSAAVLSNIGSSIHSIAVIWISYSVSGDASVVAVVALSALAPDLLFSLPAGTIADRFNRKRLLISADIVRAIAIAVLPVALLMSFDQYIVQLLVATSIVEGVMGAFVSPARSAALPHLVKSDQLDSANALLNLTSSASRVFYIVGGGLIAVVGPTVAFAINAASFAISGVLLISLPPHLSEESQQPSSMDGISQMVRDGREGLRYIVNTPTVLSVILLSVLAGFSMGPLGVILPFYLESMGHAGSASFSIFYGGTFIGILVGSIAIGNMDLLVHRHRGKLMIFGLFVSGVSLFGISFLVPRSSYEVTFGAALMTLFGSGIAIIQVPGGTLMQKTIPDEIRGKVFSVVKTASLIAPPISIIIAGPLLDSYSAGTLLFTQSAILMGSCLILALTPLFKVRGDISVQPLTD